MFERVILVLLVIHECLVLPHLLRIPSDVLKVKHSGGETSFPKGNGGTGIAKKGTAVLFYSLLEDRNGDDLSLHQAIPASKGEKWLAKFWVWDPRKKQ